MGNFVPEQLEKAAELYRQRNKLYGQNYKLFGHVMAEMFPDGLTIKSPQDWNRIGVFVQIMSKMTRYSANFTEGGHADSLLDNSVYHAMLAELDSELPKQVLNLRCDENQEHISNTRHYSVGQRCDFGGVHKGIWKIDTQPRWLHCSPELLNGGILCEFTTRRNCQCEPKGSHDHYVQFCGECGIASTGKRCPKHFTVQGL